LKEISIGLSLGDLNIQKRQSCVNACLRFTQGSVHSDYLNHLYIEFQDLCPQAPKIFNPQPDKRTGIVYSVIYFKTYSLPCFNELYILFYPDGRKIVPLNIAELLTPLGLVYWICDDGTWDKQNRHVRLCTHSFTLAEVQLLADALNKNFDLKCYVNKHTGGGYIIIIPSYSVPKLQGLLKNIMPPMMLYKIGL